MRHVESDSFHNMDILLQNTVVSSNYTSPTNQHFRVIFQVEFSYDSDSKIHPVTHMDELWGVYQQYFQGSLSSHNETALYSEKNTWWLNNWAWIEFDAIFRQIK